MAQQIAKEDTPTIHNSFTLLEGQPENPVYDLGLEDPNKNILHPYSQKK